MNKLIVTLCLALFTTVMFSQETITKVNVLKVEPVIELSVKSTIQNTTVARLESKRVLIRVNFDKSIFLFRQKTSKKIKFC